MAHFLRKRGTRCVYIYTETLSKRSDMQLIDASNLAKAKQMAGRSLALEERLETVHVEEKTTGPRALTELQLADEESVAGVDTGPEAVSGSETSTPETATGPEAPDSDDAGTEPEGDDDQNENQTIALEKPLEEMTKAELGDVAQNNFGIELDQANLKEELVMQVQTMIDKAAA